MWVLKNLKNSLVLKIFSAVKTTNDSLTWLSQIVPWSSWTTKWTTTSTTNNSFINQHSNWNTITNTWSNLK